MTCLACDGEGVLLVCPDDMCRGLGECIHGDGEIACPKCHGSGEVPNKVDLCDGNCRGCTGCEPEDDV